MAGGASTPDLVIAAAGAGALGFLAGGYKAGEALAGEMTAVRAATGEPFGVNLFVPGPPAADPEAVASYLESLRPEAEASGCELGEPTWDDDRWEEKLSVLLADPPPVVSFTFGCPEREIIEAFCHAGSLVVVTVTTPDEARIAADRGAGALCVQGAEAGGHRGSFSADSEEDHPLVDLLQRVAGVTDLPQIAAGGLSGGDGVRRVLAAGAVAAQCGTAFLRCPESGASAAHQAALVAGVHTTTAITRAFSGRRARGLRNRFMLDHPDAPAAYPEINHATRPLRAAAAASGDTESMSLWAGQGFRWASDRPAGEIVEMLSP